MILLSLALSLHASAGKIAVMKGELWIERSGTTLPGSVGASLEEKDVIHLGEASRAQILFVDKTIISLGPKSRFTIQAYNADQAAPKAEFGIVQGTFRAITGQIGKIQPNAFKLSTRTSTIGIRGTQFMGEVGRTERIACTQGRIFVETNLGEVEVMAGYITRLQPDQAPTQPETYTRDEINELSERVDSQGEVLRPEESTPPPTAETEQTLQETDPAPASDEDEAQTGDTVPEPVTASVDDTTNTDVILEVADVLGIDTESYTEEEIVTLTQIIADQELTEKILSGEIDPNTLLSTPDTGSDLPAGRQVLTVEAFDAVNYGFWILESAPEAYAVSDILDVWVSGTLTAATTIETYMQDPTATASYSGSSVGVITSGGISEEAAGSIGLTIDFADVANPVSGSISLTSTNPDTALSAVELTVGSATLDPGGFTLGFSNADGSGSGAFYGTDAQQIGGTFDATNIDGTDTSAFGAFGGEQ